VEPLLYQPEGDPIVHQISAELALHEGMGLTFKIRSDGEEIGEIDVELASDEIGFISGNGPGEAINNGYLTPASLAVLSCLREDHCFDRIQLFDIDDQPLN
jgi:hypothetical protein